MVKVKPSILKSPLWPALLSALVLPGVGQFFNRDTRKGIFFAAAFLIPCFWFSKVLTESLSTILPGTPEEWAQNPDLARTAITTLVKTQGQMFLTFYLLVFIVWIASVVDAYTSARKKINFLLPPPDENSNA